MVGAKRAMATVELKNITKSFRGKTGTVRAVNDLTVTVADREFLVLVGPSGCGKTTTLRLIAGLEGPDTGGIRIGEREVTRMAPKDRDVAMVFQDYALYPHMTVYRNMAFGLRMRRVPKDEVRSKVAAAARLLGISHLLQRKPGALSGGERQRVAVGRAIVRRPRVFLFDEPLSNLDTTLRVRMRTEIKSLHRELATTMIYVTHDQEEAMTLGDRLVVMKEGSVQQGGRPLEVYDRPANRFVAGFIGTPTMNFLGGRLERDGADRFFSGRAGRWKLPLEVRRNLGDVADQPVVAGIRPEHVCPAEAAGASGGGGPESWTAPLPCPVQVVEPLGDCSHVHLTAPGGASLVGRFGPTTTLAPGDRVEVRLDLSRIHLFAADATGQRLN